MMQLGRASDRCVVLVWRIYRVMRVIQTPQ